MGLDSLSAIYFWGFLFLYGIVMYWISPRAKTPASFFQGFDRQGRAASRWSLTTSIFITLGSLIFIMY